MSSGLPGLLVLPVACMAMGSVWISSAQSRSRYAAPGGNAGSAPYRIRIIEGATPASPSLNQMQPVGIAEDGQIAATVNGRAVLWQDGRVTDLGALPGDVVSHAVAINRHGDVLCESEHHNRMEAVILSKGVLRHLGSLGGLVTFVNGINDSLQVVGSSSVAGPGAEAVPQHPFLWDNGKMIDLGVPSGYQEAQATAISANGRVVGNAYSRSGPMVGITWFHGIWTKLPLLAGYPSATPVAVNSRGQIAGIAFLHEGPPPDDRAVMWDATGIHDLGTLGGKFSEARTINDDGMIGGTAQDAQGNWWPVVWRGGKITKLSADSTLDRQPYVSCINRRGDVLFGFCRLGTSYSNVTRAYVWHDGHSRAIDPPHGMSLSAAIRVDDNGAVLASGYRSTDRATPTNQMYFLIRNGQITDLSPALHGLYAMMNALNSHDDIAGEIGLNAPESHAMRPYLYRNGQQIPIKSVNGMPVTATALNDHGEVTGGFQRSQAGGVDSTHAFRWRGGRMVDIDGRPAGTSQGQAIDNLGAIWGWRQIDSGYENTFLDGKGPGAITSSDTVTAFNARGDACGKRFVGTYESNNGGSVQQREHAMYWSHGKALDLSPSGANNEAAIALNNHAQVVGRGEGGPFLWAQGKRTPISSLISARAGWQVLTVTGINDRGEIVGVAFKDRAVRACILTRIGRQ